MNKQKLKEAIESATDKLETYKIFLGLVAMQIGEENTAALLKTAKELKNRPKDEA